MGIKNGGIRNESMKKFGTPIGAGPGSESEKVGLVAAGTPLPVGRSLAGVVVVLDFFFFFLAFGCPATEEGPSPLLAPLGTGVVLDALVVLLEDEPDGLCEGEVEVEVDVVGPEPDEVDELVGVLELVAGAMVVVVVVVVVDTAGVVEVVGAHCSLSEATGPVMGRPIAEMGVPGATFTLKTKVWPLTRVTVTLQASADAVGMAASAMATKIAPAMASTASSFRRPIMTALLGPSRWCALQ